MLIDENVINTTLYQTSLNKVHLPTLLGLGSFDSTIVGNTMINTEEVDFAFSLT